MYNLIVENQIVVKNIPADLVEIYLEAMSESIATHNYIVTIRRAQ